MGGVESTDSKDFDRDAAVTRGEILDFPYACRPMANKIAYSRSEL